jgi:hypothetical protein
MKKLYSIILLLFCCIFISCEAPHINPLDPENPDNEFRGLKGTIQTQTIPRIPIAGVSISWENENIVVQTNSNGEYSLDKLSRRDGWLRFDKAGYIPDSQFIEWGEDKLKTIDKFLNSIPSIQELLIYSSVRNQRLAPAIITLTVETSIQDVENDIDSVFIENTELGIFENIPEISRGVYKSKQFSPGELSLKTLDEIIGKELSIVVKDRLSNKFTVARSNLKRIIRQEIQTRSPVNNQDSVSTTPTLEWERFEPGFKHTYLIQIRTNDIAKNLVWQKSNISSDSVRVNVDSELTGNSNGEYFWEIWAIDEFNNISISRRSAFKVIQ